MTDNLNLCQKLAEFLTIELQDAFHMFRFFASYDAEKKVFFMVPYGCLHATNTTFLQILVSVLGLQMGQTMFFYVINSSTNLSKLSFFELHLVQSFMVVDLYKFLDKKDEFKSIECLIGILKDNLSVMMLKFGLMEIYNVLVGCMVPLLNLDKKKSDFENQERENGQISSANARSVKKFEFYLGNNYVD